MRACAKHRAATQATLVAIAMLMAGFGLVHATMQDGRAHEAAAGAVLAPTAVAVSDVTAEIKNFKYDPDPIELPVGGTITWTNRDAVPHTVTATDGELPQSEALGLGDSFSQTFDRAGTYDYVCEFHAQMKGTIVVR